MAELQPQVVRLLLALILLQLVNIGALMVVTALLAAPIQIIVPIQITVSTLLLTVALLLQVAALRTAPIRLQSENIEAATVEHLPQVARHLTAQIILPVNIGHHTVVTIHQVVQTQTAQDYPQAQAGLVMAAQLIHALGHAIHLAAAPDHLWAHASLMAVA